MVSEVGGRVAAGLKILRNAWDCYDFHGFESALEGSGWLQNQKKCIALSSFALLGMGWKGASGLRIIRNARDYQHFHSFDNRWS